MHYKAIFLDIDDTLIGDDKCISPGNLRAIQRAAEHGVYITAATGRGYLGCSRILEELNVKGPAIVYGGASIVDTRDGSVLFIAEIDSNLIKEALAFSHELGLVAQIYQGDRVIVEQDNAYSARYVRALQLPYTVEKNVRRMEWLHVPKILVFSPLEIEYEMVKKYENMFGGRLEVASSKPGFIELNQFGVNKGTAMLRLAAQLGFTREQLIAIGDNTLDLQMIQMAGLGVCVGNGQQVIKDIADVVAPACADDGVKWVIDNYIFQGGTGENDGKS